jgi:asparagine synthase (glutamine-hydrolysing)
MCGIFFYLGKFYTLSELMPHFMKSSHRGPDSSFLRSITGSDAFMGFHRLAIVDTSRDGDQPFENVKTQNYAMCNGEIYNHKIIRQKLHTGVHSKSDCAVILPLYESFGIQEMTKYLDGDFGFLILDTKAGLIHLGRDPMGVKPVFYCLTSRGEFIVSSEMKSIIGLSSGEKVTMLPSGTTLTYDISSGEISTFRYWNPVFPLEDITSCKTYNETHIKQTIRKKLTSAVEKRLMTDRPLGLLISGGLDSSLIAGITKKLVGDKISEIKSFSIGMPGSPDVINAQIVADYLGTTHHTVNFTVEEGISAVKKVIKQLETYDITTIRASTPQYLLSKYISENTDVKVILSGEGADELYAGYLYSHLAPSNDHLQKDSERLMKELEVFDVLRTDRTTAGNGLEVRVPFLDRGFIKYTASIPGKFKNPNPSSGFDKRIEKKLLRDSFCNELGEPIIPDKIMYRIKNAFSDACGYDWIPSLKQHCEGLVTDEEFSTRETRYQHCTPPTKEAYFYRKTFEEFYPNQEHLVPHYWLPNWMDNKGEPSAKVLQLVE